MTAVSPPPILSYSASARIGSTADGQGVYAEGSPWNHMSASTVKVLWGVVLNLVFGLSAWLCIFRTDIFVKWQQKKYANSAFVRAYPFSGMVLKSWYPTYIRFWGIVILLFTLAIDYLVLTQPPR
jgi:hypothetical protein